MSKETDYVQLCKLLRKDSPHSSCKTDNKYICAHTFVKNYANKDLNKLKKLKAESLSAASYDRKYEQSISLTALVFSVLALVPNLLNIDFFTEIYLFFSPNIILIAFIFVIVKNIITANKLKYHDYIDIAIEEVEKELTS